MRIYITADIHGRPDILYEVLTMEKDGVRILKPGDMLSIAGDAGVGFFNTYCNEEKYYDYINEYAGRMQIRIIFIDGNHEVFPKLYAYPEEEWNGGKVHRIRENIIHCIRGEVYDIEESDGRVYRIFTFGGGYSLDKDRRTEGIDWFPEENITEEQRINALRNLERVGYKVDYCITHTAPIETVERLGRKYYGEIRIGVIEEFELTNFLQLIADNRELPEETKWYFGHFHKDDDALWDRYGRRQYALMHEVRDLETGEVVYTRQRRSDSGDRTVFIKDEWN